MGFDYAFFLAYGAVRARFFPAQRASNDTGTVASHRRRHDGVLVAVRFFSCCGNVGVMPPQPRAPYISHPCLHHASIDPPEAELFDSPSTHDTTRRQAQAKPYPQQPRPRSPTTPAMSSSSNGGKKPATGGGRGGPTIRTLADINRGPAGFPGPGGSGSDSDEPQEYYTGGEKRYISVSLGGLC